MSRDSWYNLDDETQKKVLQEFTRYKQSQIAQLIKEDSWKKDYEDMLKGTSINADNLQVDSDGALINAKDEEGSDHLLNLFMMQLDQKLVSQYNESVVKNIRHFQNRLVRDMKNLPNLDDLAELDEVDLSMQGVIGK